MAAVHVFPGPRPGKGRGGALKAMPAAAPCPQESRQARRQRARHILAALVATYQDAKTELYHENPFQLLVATVLSAQSTDKGVNRVTPELFRRWPTPEALANARPQAVEEVIKTLGLFRTKARNLVALAQALVETYGGEVPPDPRELQKLPGVGWKTATVVAGAAFGIPGIAVDTHVSRVARRLCLSEATSPPKIGRDLETLFPKERWIFVHHALVLHGRYVCTARKPKCARCPLAPHCPSYHSLVNTLAETGSTRASPSAGPTSSTSDSSQKT